MYDTPYKQHVLNIPQLMNTEDIISLSVIHELHSILFLEFPDQGKIPLEPAINIIETKLKTKYKYAKFSLHNYRRKIHTILKFILNTLRCFDDVYVKIHNELNSYESLSDIEFVFSIYNYVLDFLPTPYNTLISPIPRIDVNYTPLLEFSLNSSTSNGLDKAIAKYFFSHYGIIIVDIFLDQLPEQIKQKFFRTDYSSSLFNNPFIKGLKCFFDKIGKKDTEIIWFNYEFKLDRDCSNIEWLTIYFEIIRSVVSYIIVATKKTFQHSVRPNKILSRVRDAILRDESKTLNQLILTYHILENLYFENKYLKKYISIIQNCTNLEDITGVSIQNLLDNISEWIDELKEILSTETALIIENQNRKLTIITILLMIATILLTIDVSQSLLIWIYMLLTH